MSYSEKDYSKKICFAEDWLKKAKLELEQGSSVTAGSHIILAIAEMETIKRSLFSDSIQIDAIQTAPIQIDAIQIKKAKKVQRNSWMPYRPLFAFALLALAVGIFSFTMTDFNSVPIYESATMETRNDSISNTLVARENLYESILEQKLLPPVTESLVTKIKSNVTSIDSLEPAQIPIASEPISKTKPTYRPKISPTTPTAAKNHGIVGDKSVVAENKSNPPAWLFSRQDEPELLMKEIQLETIIAARESLNGK